MIMIIVRVGLVLGLLLGVGLGVGLGQHYPNPNRNPPNQIVEKSRYAVFRRRSVDPTSVGARKSTAAIHARLYATPRR